MSTYKRGMLTAEIDAIKNGAPSLRQAARTAKKALKARKRIAKAQARSERPIIKEVRPDGSTSYTALEVLKSAPAATAALSAVMKSAVAGDIAAQRLVRELVEAGNSVVGEIQRADAAKAAYDSIGLGNKPAANIRTGEGDNRPVLSDSFRMTALGEVGIKPMPAVTNTTVGDVHDPRSLSSGQMGRLVAAARAQFMSGQDNPHPQTSDDLAEFYRSSRVAVDPLTMKPILTTDLADKLTPTGGDSADIGSRSGSGRARTNPKASGSR